MGAKLRLFFRKSVSLQKRNVSPINIYKVWKR
nr:MAG TPA_asm: hypothetical protein [Caudoviricetes sp.]